MKWILNKRKSDEKNFFMHLLLANEVDKIDASVCNLHASFGLVNKGAHTAANCVVSVLALIVSSSH